jgi:hypothetical protein
MACGVNEGRDWRTALPHSPRQRPAEVPIQQLHAPQLFAGAEFNRAQAPAVAAPFAGCIGADADGLINV